MTAAAQPIPGPPGNFLLGNLLDIDKDDNLGSFQNLQKKHGDIYRLCLGSDRLVVVSSHELVDEACDETRFKKVPKNVLFEIRNGVHDGLFTAFLEEPNWGIAHRVLMPAFGPLAIRNMFDEMHDIASQLVLKWARHGPQHRILLTDDFTRLTLDTIGLCSMGFRFNSFYSENLHPFIQAMGDFLTESGRKTTRLPAPAFFYRQADQEYEYNIRVMRETAEAVLQERVADPSSKRHDLLAAMLKGRDSLTGEKMTDQSIIDNLITFLIAGHETTSGMLSYAVHQLLKNPEEYRKAQREVDEVVGKGGVTVQHMQKLPHIAAILRETLRLDSPVSLSSVSPIERTMLAGKYEVQSSDIILSILSNLHTDPKVYDQPLKFFPERMLDDNFKKLPKNSWKPFGNGVRACIGRAFAWQEAILIMALILQNFDLSLHDPEYKLRHKQTLTIKPADLYIHAKLRQGLDPTELEARLSGFHGARAMAAGSSSALNPSRAENNANETAMKIFILYGSNSGTCESMAQSLASGAPRHGYNDVIVCSMDQAVQTVPQNGTRHVLVIITASYEGEPPDNAVEFVRRLEDFSERDTAFKDTSFAIFGCGNHDWARTFHRIPRLVDQRLEMLGGNRLAKIGLADAASEDMLVAFETWEDEVLWPLLNALRQESGGSVPMPLPNTLKVQFSDTCTSIQRRIGAKEAKVLQIKTLTADGEPVKKHMEIKLPLGMEYKVGDALAVLPSNPKSSVLRALRRFNVPWDAIITIEGSSTTLPTNVSMYARAILSDFVELSRPITKRGILQIAEATTEAQDRKELKELAEKDEYNREITAKRISLLDLLERYPSVNLPLGTFLAGLPPMRVRQYSISSSPRVDPSVATITFSVLSASARSGQGEFHGVASSYLSSLQAEDMLHVLVQSSNVHFRLPKNAGNEPIIMIAAGTGIAPFRGFIQERAELVKGKSSLAPALLYFGSREAGRDDLYSDELAEWEKEGAVAVRRAYSRGPQASRKYVQDVLWDCRDEFLELWENNAKIYVCGSRAISQGVEKVAIRILREAAEKKGDECDESKIKKWWSGLRNSRYVVDTFD